MKLDPINQLDNKDRSAGAIRNCEIMTAKFDPYYYFLGIGRRHQPADHYRILGVEQFESDIEIIEMAADRQMAHLHRHESSDHCDDVAMLMSAVSRARLCLLNPSRRDAYDADLREALVDADAAPEQEATPSESPQEPESGQHRRIVILDEILDHVTSNRAIAPEQVDSLWDSLDLDYGVDRHKAEMLFEINDAITSQRASAPGWRELFVRAISHHLLADLKSFGEIDDEEGNWLVEKLARDKQLDSNELALLAELRARTGGEVGGRLRRLLEKFADKLPTVEPEVTSDDLSAMTNVDSAAIVAQPVATTQEPAWQTSDGATPADLQLSNSNTASLPPPSIPTFAEPKSILASPFTTTLAERTKQTCHFCGQRQASDIFAVKQAMHGNVQRMETGVNLYKATWENTEVTVPRCDECNKHHRRINKAMGVGALLGLIPGALGFLSILAIGAGGLCIGTSLALIGTLIGAVVAFASASAETPYRMKNATDVKGFERIKKLEAEGWKCGRKPALRDQNTAPIADTKNNE